MENLVVEMQALLDNPCDAEEIKTSIYKVPPLISNNNEKAYRPRVVSFGPYHYGEHHLASMEAHKKRAFHRCINRLGRTLQEVIDFVAEVVEELKESYDSLDPKWQDDTEGFMKLMILDGCFMLELLHFSQLGFYYSNYDLVFSEHGDTNVLVFIRDDMLLLENQLPMSLLFRLKNILENDEPNIQALNEDILRFLAIDIDDYPTMGKCLHVLDLFRKAILRTCNQPRDATPQSLDQGERQAKMESAIGHDVVRPAAELQEAGIRFRKSKSKSLLDITFDNGILKLPKFTVNDHTESIFLNLIAFERCHIPASNDITSFIAFMNCIIDDSRDIKLLSSKGIINNILGTDKEAADLFNTMSKDLILWNDSLSKVYRELVDYSKKPWPKYRAYLNQTYLKNPWAIISVIAAFILFSLATVQTVFTILN